MTTATTQPTIQHEINCTMAQSLPPPSSSPIHSSSPQIHGLLLSTVTTPPSSTLSYQRSRPLTHTSTAVKVRQRGITPVYFIIIMKIVTPHHLLSSPFLFHRRFRSVKARKWLRSEENCECSNWLWINNKYGQYCELTYLFIRFWPPLPPPTSKWDVNEDSFNRRFHSVQARKWLRSDENCEWCNWLRHNADWTLWSHLFYHPISAAAHPTPLPNGNVNGSLFQGRLCGVQAKGS